MALFGQFGNTFTPDAGIAGATDAAYVGVT